MVGPPKTLQDLRRVDGAVRVTRRACKRTNLLDREEMIMRRGVALLSCDWSLVVSSMICPDCASDDVKVQIEAFGEGLPEMRRRRAILITLELALKILHAASYTASAGSVSVESVRLALRVIHPHLQNRAALEIFWAAYANPEKAVWESPVKALDGIVQGLLDRGYGLPAELRMGNIPKHRTGSD